MNIPARYLEKIGVVYPNITVSHLDFNQDGLNDPNNRTQITVATPDQLTQFFRSHQAGRKSAIARRIQQIQEAGTPLTRDQSIVVPAQSLTQALIALLVVLNQLSDFNAKIAQLFETLPDAELSCCIYQVRPRVELQEGASTIAWQH